MGTRRKHVEGFTAERGVGEVGETFVCSAISTTAGKVLEGSSPSPLVVGRWVGTCMGDHLGDLRACIASDESEWVRSRDVFVLRQDC